MLLPNQNHRIPEKTLQVARATFPEGNTLMMLRDEMGPIFEDERFSAQS